MSRILLFSLLGIFLSTSYLAGQSEGDPEAYAIRLIGSNHLWPLENVDDISLDDFKPGLEFEYFRYLNDLLDLSIPFRFSSTSWSDIDDGSAARRGSNFGLDALLNLNVYKGNFFRPRLFAGIGTAFVNGDDFALDIPLGLGLNFNFGGNTSLSTTFAYHL
ncbi:MAG: hypothetical protein AAFU03_09290, partial [Bacteroidota bacterium]